MDSIILKKLSRGKVQIIRSGQEIKVYLNDKTKKKGIFKLLSADSLAIESKGELFKFSINDIVKIKRFSNTAFRIIGGVFVGLGAITIAYGGIALVLGTYALFTNSLAAIVLVAVPPIWLAGLGSYGFGKVISYKRFKIGKKWSFVHE